MRRHFQRHGALLVSLLLGGSAACAGPDLGGDGFSGPGIGPAPSDEGAGSTDGSGDTGIEEEDDEDEGSGDDGAIGSHPEDEGGEPPPKFDVSGWSDIPPIENGCTKVDFLFVIDDSGSMQTHQANLIANYPAFIDGIQSTLATVDDYHVGVITTDEYEFAGPGCATELSGLVSKTQAGDCGPFADGHNYMTQDDDLAQAFDCAADVGTDGNWIEKPMAATLQAVQGVVDGPGECNEGFLRDDSLLVVVILTDEADGNAPHLDPEAAVDPSHTSPGFPKQWFDYLVKQRGDVEGNVVVISFLMYEGGPCEPMWPQDDGENIKVFTELFTHGYVAGICEQDYAPHFEHAVDVVADACNNYVSPG